MRLSMLFRSVRQRTLRSLSRPAGIGSGLLRPRSAAGRGLLPALMVLFGAAAAGHAQTVVATDTVGDSPYAIAVNPVTGITYVANATGSISIINGATNAVTTVTLGAALTAVALNTVTNTVYFTTDNNTVTVLNGSTNAVSAIPVGSGPQAIAVNEATNTIYVTNYDDGTVSVINGSTNAVTSVTVKSEPYAVAVNTATNTVYVANYNDGSVSVINGANLTVTNIPVGNKPVALAVNPITDKVYVATSGSKALTIIDGTDNNFRTLTLPATPLAVTVNPVTNTIYVAAAVDNVFVINGRTNAVTSVPVGDNKLFDIAVNVVTNTIYVTNPSDNLVAVLDGTTNAVSTLAVGYTPQALAVNPVTNTTYVANFGNTSNHEPATVSVIDGSTNKATFVNVSGNTPEVPELFDPVLNPATNTVYVPDPQYSTIYVINGTTNAFLKLAVPSGSNAAAVNAVTNTIYVASGNGNTVSVINGATNTIASTVTVGEEPQALAVNSLTDTIYVANYLDGTVSVIDGSANAVVNTLTVGSSPVAVAVNPITNTIYVANEGSNNLSVIDGFLGTVTNVNVGTYPVALCVDAQRNVIYVLNQEGNTVSVVAGSTNTIVTTIPTGVMPSSLTLNEGNGMLYVANSMGKSITAIDTLDDQTSTIALSFQPNAVAVNSSLNEIYAVGHDVPTMAVINGATNTVTPFSINSAQMGPAKGGGYYATVNPATNTVYVTDLNNKMTVIVPSITSTVPITAAVSGVVDSQTVNTTNVFETRNPTPSFSVQVTSAFTADSAYSGIENLTNPPPVSVYYQVDGDGTWTPAVAGTTGNPATFTFTLPTSPTGPTAGPHLLYVYAAYGDESVTSGGNVGGNSGSSNSSPILSNVTAFNYQIDGPAIQLNGSPSPLTAGNQVTLTATLPTQIPADPVNFWDTFGGSVNYLGSAEVQNGKASITAGLSTPGNHSIIAVYTGDSTYGESGASFTQVVDGTTPQTITFPQPATPVEYTAGASATLAATASSGLAVTYSIVSGPATLSGSTVSYTGVGTVVIAANQAGNDTYSAAPQVTVSITVLMESIFIANGVGSVTAMDDRGNVLSSAVAGGGMGAAVDGNGVVWSINPGGNSISTFTDAGALLSTYTAGGVSNATALAIDGVGNVFLTNYAGTISALTNSGAALFSSPIAGAAAISTPTAISIDSSGSLWIASAGNHSVVEILGVAAPVVTPTVEGVIQNKVGGRP